MDAWIRGWAMFPIGPIRFYVTRTEVLRLGPLPANGGTFRSTYSFSHRGSEWTVNAPSSSSRFRRFVRKDVRDRH